MSIFLFWSCEKPKQEDSLSISMPISQVGAEAGSQEVFLSTYDSWKITVEYHGTEKNWAELSSVSGSAGKGRLDLSYGENKTGRNRTLRLVLESDGRFRAWDFSQSHRNTVPSRLPSPYHEDPVRNWMELPGVSTADGLYFFTHERTQKSGRDWSFYYDTGKRIANWVAYPLNADYIAGGGGRTDAWDENNLDPHLPSDLQAVMSENHRFRSPYQRGHQLPSADRNVKAENVRTFYGTNITPQNGRLNTRAWQKLETQVRNWSFKFDTLYVVTGCTSDRTIGSDRDAYGQPIAVPGGFFKALLGYSAKRTASPFCSSHGGYTAIGFYFDNSPADKIEGHSMTIRQLEKKVGIDFFVNLLSELGPERYDSVESEWDGFWSKY